MPTLKKILVVDDDVNFTQALNALFGDSGYKINIANSGIEALRFLREFYFDLILLDLNMPDIDGIHVARVSREHRPATRIGVITGYKEQYESDLAGLKVDFIMQKPIGINELSEKIARTLGPAPAPSGNKFVGNGIPKAKLLFVEHDDIIYTNLFLPYFSKKNVSKEAAYETMLAVDKDKALTLVRIFRPDIVILNTDALEIYSYLKKELTAAIALSKEIIVHGLELYAKKPEELGLDPNEVTAIEGGFLNLDYPARLEETVKEFALSHGLVEPSSA